ncbi:Sphingomyelinase [Dyadobacter sp. CECT 9275]|uniref:Sphingomyelinase n=1 Tax=Dyadobacter helix TaxID=2822344 RepID=A0A916JGX3_9BACT|nr:endonuclease/exonuclease/phosphatase family protein [Dyadobacter sp. CECT 9275]CAG5003122.1 Sphingomyelinase [Dyadobacter sp. CECT 9275]
MIWKSITRKRFLNLAALASLAFFSSGFDPGKIPERSLSFRLQSPGALPDTTAGAFSVLTYNIAGLPEMISSATTRRAPSIAAIGRKLNAFDVVNVQEDFNYNRYLYNGGNAHPFRTQTKGSVLFGDGLNTLSRYPVHHVRRISWNDCTGADCLTPKGFTYSRLEIARNVFVDLYNVHANAYNHLAAAAARRSNMNQLSDFIRKNSRGQAVIVMGDLNAHYSYSYDNVHQLLANNHLTDAWVMLVNHDHLPQPVQKLPESQILRMNSRSESIDKILYRSNDRIQLNISEYNLNNQLFNDKNGTPLSDHHPVSLRFSWKLQDKKLLAAY